MDLLKRCILFYTGFFVVPLPEAAIQRFINNVALETTSGPMQAFIFDTVSSIVNALYALIYYLVILIIFNWLLKKQVSKVFSFFVGLVSGLILYYVVGPLTKTGFALVLVQILIGFLLLNTLFVRVFSNKRA